MVCLCWGYILCIHHCDCHILDNGSILLLTVSSTIDLIFFFFFSLPLHAIVVFIVWQSSQVQRIRDRRSSQVNSVLFAAPYPLSLSKPDSFCLSLLSVLIVHLHCPVSVCGGGYEGVGVSLLKPSISPSRLFFSSSSLPPLLLPLPTYFSCFVFFALFLLC